MSMYVQSTRVAGDRLSDMLRKEARSRMQKCYNNFFFGDEYADRTRKSKTTMSPESLCGFHQLMPDENYLRRVWEKLMQRHASDLVNETSVSMSSRHILPVVTLEEGPNEISEDVIKYQGLISTKTPVVVEIDSEDLLAVVTSLPAIMESREHGYAYFRDLDLTHLSEGEVIPKRFLGSDGDVKQEMFVVQTRNETVSFANFLGGRLSQIFTQAVTKFSKKFCLNRVEAARLLLTVQSSEMNPIHGGFTQFCRYTTYDHEDLHFDYKPYSVRSGTLPDNIFHFCQKRMELANRIETRVPTLRLYPEPPSFDDVRRGLGKRASSSLDERFSKSKRPRFDNQTSLPVRNLEMTRQISQCGKNDCERCNRINGENDMNGSRLTNKTTKRTSMNVTETVGSDAYAQQGEELPAVEVQVLSQEPSTSRAVCSPGAMSTDLMPVVLESRLDKNDRRRKLDSADLSDSDSSSDDEDDSVEPGPYMKIFRNGKRWLETDEPRLNIDIDVPSKKKGKKSNGEVGSSKEDYLGTNVSVPPRRNDEDQSPTDEETETNSLNEFEDERLRFNKKYSD